MPILTKRANKTPLGIYVHVPFCRSKCQYCDFYSLCTKEDKVIDGYLDAVCDHIKEAGELASCSTRPMFPSVPVPEKEQPYICAGNCSAVNEQT